MVPLYSSELISHSREYSEIYANQESKKFNCVAISTNMLNLNYEILFSME